MTRARDVANIDGLLTTTGDTYYASAAGTPARLGIGSSAQVLTVASGVPSWATPAGGGKILQVVFATNEADTNIESTTFTDTGLTATITPTSNTSRIAIFATNQGEYYRAGDTPLGGMRLLRGATVLMASNIDGFFESGSTFAKTSMVQNYVDSPATTSATTYKTQGCGTHVAVRLRFGYDGSDDTMILMEIGA